MTRAAVLLPSQLLPSKIVGVPSILPPSTSEMRDYRLGSPGRPAKIPTLVEAVFDDSGSLYGPAGNDPLANRYAEVAAAFTAIARRGSRHELAAVGHFDTPSSGQVGPVPLTRSGLAVLRRGLERPPDAAGTSELGPSLRRAVEIAEGHPDHRGTLVVLTDFLLADANPGEVLSDLCAFPGDVHAVVLGTRLPEGLLDPRITVTHVGRQDPPGAVARALFQSLTRHRPGSQSARS